MPSVEQRARELLAQVDPAATWEEMIAYYGTAPNVIIQTERMFLAAEPFYLAGYGRAWFCYLLVGSISEALALAPYELPYLAWGRAKTKSLHFTRTERIRALTHHGRI